MKIYIVTSGEYSDYGIEKVFTKREKAELYVKYHSGNYNWDNPRIEEYETSDDYIVEAPQYLITMTFNLLCDINGHYRELLKNEEDEITDQKDKTYIHYYDYGISGSEVIIRKYIPLTSENPDERERARMKAERIGYDICYQICYMLSEGAKAEDVKKFIESYKEEE